MAELNSSNEEPHVLPSKRKQAAVQGADDDSTKKHCLEKCTDNDTLPEVQEKIINENGDKDEEEEEEEEEEENYEGEYDVDSDDEEEEDDDDEVEHSNGGGEIDRKGKGIMKDDKGKGKMIEESEEDDSDDDGASESDGDGDGDDDDDDDLSDDPLAEVDLDNILPSRTRRRTVPPGVRISSDKLTNDKDNDA